LKLGRFQSIFAYRTAYSSIAAVVLHQQLLARQCLQVKNTCKGVLKEHQQGQKQGRKYLYVRVAWGTPPTTGEALSGNERCVTLAAT